MDETVESITVYVSAVGVYDRRGCGKAGLCAVIDEAGTRRVLMFPYLIAVACIQGDDMPGFGGNKEEVLQTVRCSDGTEENRRSIGNTGQSDLKQLAEPIHIVPVDDPLRGVIPAML